MTKVLLFHVVSGEHLAADVVEMTQLVSVEKSDLTVKVKGSKVQIENATIALTDINGILLY